MNKKNMSNALTSAQMLKSFVGRAVRIKEQIRELQQDVKDVAAEAVSSGFDRKVFGQMVKETMMDEKQREEQRDFEEVCEVYRASLGMLRGTPLGDAARKRAADRGAPSPGDQSDIEDVSDSTAASPEPDAAEPAEPFMPPEDMDAAREKGREAGAAGVKIFANPYVAGDPRRAAWDEGHCEASGTDGMEIPPSWRRRPKRQPGAGDEGRAP